MDAELLQIERERILREAGEPPNAAAPCGLLGDLLREEECASCPGKPRVKIYACPLRGECTVRLCRTCQYYGPQPMPSFAAVIASRNEGPKLAATIASLEKSRPGLSRVIVVDDASDAPEPHATIRNEVRQGVSRSRHVGCREVTEPVAFLCDGHMEFSPTDAPRVARLAQVTDGFAYAGCDGHYRAALRVENDILRCKWQPRTARPTERTTGKMGAGYAIPMARLRDMGGWICLPAPWGWDEEAMSILALKHRLPITADQEVQTKHDWSERRVPTDTVLRNLLAMLRLLFEDATWEAWKRKLEVVRLDRMELAVPDALIAEMETPEMLHYSAALRERCKLDDLGFWIALAGAMP